MHVEDWPTLPELEQRWCEAHARAIRAERHYADLADEDSAAADAAWLELWRAEEQEREIDRTMTMLRSRG